jgi:hypothetical protein
MKIANFFMTMEMITRSDAGKGPRLLKGGIFLYCLVCTATALLIMPLTQGTVRSSSAPSSID